MENKVFEANLTLIEEYNKGFSKLIRGLENYSQIFELTKTELDEFNLKVNEVELHSSKGAVNEAKKIVSGINNIGKENSICIIFGLGLGYLFDEVVQNAKGAVILFEPNIEVLKCTLEIVELVEVLSKKNVRVCTEIEGLKRHIDEFANKTTDISISFLTSYYLVYSEQIQEVAQVVEYYRGEKTALENTIARLGFCALDNTLKNLPYLEDANFIKDFKDCFKGRAALIVGAGPSLANNIEIIKKEREKFVIFCTGSALRLVINQGIAPDFVVIIEPMPTQGQIQGLDLSVTTMILEPYSNQDAWAAEAKNKIAFMSKDNFLNDFLTFTLGIKNGDLSSLGTVSYCALKSAEIMGCDPIVLIGQDLAYSDGRCYAKGSVYENLECTLNPDTDKFEIKIAEGKYDDYLKALCATQDRAPEASVEKYLKNLNDNLYTIEGQNGEKLPTQSSYAIFIKHFEEFSALNFGIFGKQNRLINSSTGGAQINGFENLPLDEVVKTIVASGAVGVPIFERQKLDFENLYKKLEHCHKNMLEAFVLVNESDLIFEKIDKEVKMRKAFSKNAQKLFDKVAEKVNLLEENYFKKNPVIYWGAYRGAKQFFEFLSKNKPDFSNIKEFREKFAYYKIYMEATAKSLEEALSKNRKICYNSHRT